MIITQSVHICAQHKHYLCQCTPGKGKGRLWANAHWRGTDLQFKALSQTPAKATRPWTWGRCVTQLPVYFTAFTIIKLYHFVTEAHGCEQLA